MDQQEGIKVDRKLFVTDEQIAVTLALHVTVPIIDKETIYTYVVNLER